MVVLFFCSCANYKDIPYFRNSAEYDGSKGPGHYDLKIKPKDKLDIFVFSGTDAEAVSLFNISEPREPRSQDGRIRVEQGARRHQYLVDNEGNIDFPIIGLVNVGGLTMEATNEKIKNLVIPNLQPGTDCVVTTIINNFEITVMGEVKAPNTFDISRTHINVLEALAMAGDLTIYGKRDNVKILRELPDGTYEVHELDLRDANILNSPYYNLEQRDIVYVEPNEAMAQNSKVGTTTRLWLNGASITISLGSLLYRVLQ